METEDVPPPSYQHLPPISSETNDKYRWPVTQTRKLHLPPISIKTSIDGPLHSPLPAPTLRYHRQSTYTDAYVKPKPFVTHVPLMESNWMDPVGKHGDFDGVSTYDKDYDWPEKASKFTRIPLTSTIGLGILPLLGKKGGSKNIPAVDTKVESLPNITNGDAVSKKKVDFKQKRRTFKDFVPLQDLWTGESTYRTDFLIPSKRLKTKLAQPPNPELRFSGNVEMATTAMLDYQDPKYVKYDEEYEKKPKQNKDDLQSRQPFFLF